MTPPFPIPSRGGPWPEASSSSLWPLSFQSVASGEPGDGQREECGPAPSVPLLALPSFPRPASPDGGDGPPSYPSSAASGAKSDGAFPIVGRAGAKLGHSGRQAEQAITYSFRATCRIQNRLHVVRGRGWSPASSSPAQHRLNVDLCRAALTRVIAGVCNCRRNLAGSVFTALVQLRQKTTSRFFVGFFRSLLGLPLIHEQQRTQGFRAACAEKMSIWGKQ